MENQSNDRIKQDRQAAIEKKKKSLFFYEVVVLYVYQVSLLECS